MVREFGSEIDDNKQQLINLFRAIQIGFSLANWLRES